MNHFLFNGLCPFVLLSVYHYSRCSLLVGPDLVFHVWKLRQNFLWNQAHSWQVWLTSIKNVSSSSFIVGPLALCLHTYTRNDPCKGSLYHKDNCRLGELHIGYKITLSRLNRKRENSIEEPQEYYHSHCLLHLKKCSDLILTSKTLPRS